MRRPAVALPPIFARLLALLLAISLVGCASLGGRDPLALNVVGVEPLPGEGMELRMAVKLRVQNPNSAPVDYDGVALELLVNGRPLARGVSDGRGSVPRFGESLLVVPVSVSAFSVLRQMLGLSEQARLDSVPYVLRGKLGGGWFGGRRFSDSGLLDLRGVSEGLR
ncbi:LEA type 2 family protein [Pseudomonas stutzeri]|nr:LEA type 2 family protein [Stutzerimonas stutzeri]